jgi:hypothetical protein
MSFECLIDNVLLQAPMTLRHIKVTACGLQLVEPDDATSCVATDWVDLVHNERGHVPPLKFLVSKENICFFV